MNNEEIFRTGLGLKTKFLIWLVIFILTVMGIVYLYFSHHETEVLSDEIRLRGEAICNNLVTSAEDLLVMKDDLALAKLVYDTKNKNKGVITCFIIDEKKKIWAHTDVSLVNKNHEPLSGLKTLNNEPILVLSYKTPVGTEIFEIVMPIMVKGTKIGEAHLAISLAAIGEAVAQARKGVAFVAVVIMLIGIICILVLVSFIIGSLGDVARDIEAIGNGDLDRKIVALRKDEIGRITHAVKIMAEAALKATEHLGLKGDDIDLIIPHQANIRLLNAVAKRMGIDPDKKLYLNIEKYGNMSAASTAVALAEAVQEGRIRKGDIILLDAFGAGLTWGAIVIKW